MLYTIVKREDMMMKRSAGMIAVMSMVLLGGCFEKQNELHESMVSCPEKTQLISDDFEGKPVCQLRGTYSEDLSLSADKSWALKGEVHIGVDGGESAVLEIAPGTTIFGKTGADFLVITRGSKIIAEGEVSQPIIFTSMKDAAGLISVPGDWGGIAIAGNAPTNAGREERFEFSNTDVRFGGEKEDDDSGVLKYVQIRYAGNEVRPGEELNGLSLGGVGRKTVIDYVAVYNGKDDGIEAWGGNVNMSHLVLIGNGDDNLDFDHGYRGDVRHVYIEQTVVTSIHARGIETDNNKKDPAALPRTQAHVSDFEIVGTTESSEGVYSRRGSGLILSNGIIRDVGGIGIYVKTIDESRFEENHFYDVELLDCAKGAVGDRSARITDLYSFNKKYDSSIVESVSEEGDEMVRSASLVAWRGSQRWRSDWS